jgi:FtsP/CotA-like multicopper oxidase with cupredoxin domain
MKTLRLLLFALLAMSPLASGTTRAYFVAAEDVSWNFAPSGQDLTHDGPIPKPYRTTWTKTRYVEYTDGSFTVKKAQPAWLGVLGPVLRAEVGDTLLINFCNKSSGMYSMHPHGLRYDKNSEGAHYKNPGAGAMIMPGACFQYTWAADEESGPGAQDPSSRVWFYHSHSMSEPDEVNRGLIGAIIVTRAGMANPDATPKDVDREFIALFMIFNERDDKERGLMHSINGRTFGNATGFTMHTGEKVRWHLLGMGNEADMHSAHWHGKVSAADGRTTDVVELIPASMKTVEMKADNPGTWMMHCHVADHIKAGMYTTYTILP